SPAALGEASLLVFFIFMSAEGALTASGEIRDPARTVPVGLLAATATLVVLYVALQMVSQGVLGAELARQGSTPLASVAGRVLGVHGRNFLLASAGFAVFGTLTASMVSTPRAFFAAARDGLLPSRLASVHGRFRTPHVAIAAYAALVCAFAASGAFRPLAVLATIAQLTIYLVVCLAVPRWRSLRDRVPGSFRAPGGPAIPVLGAVAVVWLLWHSTGAEVFGIAALIALATTYYLLRTRMPGRLVHP